MKGGNYAGTLGRNTFYTLALYILSTLGSCDSGPVFKFDYMDEKNDVNQLSKYDENHRVTSRGFYTEDAVLISPDSLRVVDRMYIDLHNDGVLDASTASHFNMGRDGIANKVGVDTMYALTRDGRAVSISQIKECDCAAVGVKVRPRSTKGKELTTGFNEAEHRYNGNSGADVILL